MTFGELMQHYVHPMSRTNLKTNINNESPVGVSADQSYSDAGGHFMMCQLSRTLVKCSDLLPDPDHSYYYDAADGELVEGGSGSGTGPGTVTGFTTGPPAGPTPPVNDGGLTWVDPEPWILQLHTDIDGVAVQGSVPSVYGKILHGSKIRVYIQHGQNPDHGLFIELDSAVGLAQGNEVIGSAYIFQMDSARSLWKKIVVDGAGRITESTIKDGSVSQATIRAPVFWYSQDFNGRCEAQRPPLYGGTARVVSYGHENETGYDLFSARAPEYAPQGFGLFISDAQHTGDLRFSLRAMNIAFESEENAWVDPLSSEGELLSTSPTWKESSSWVDNCFDSVLDTSDPRDSEGIHVLLRVLNNGSRILINADCHYDGILISFMSTAERVVVSGTALTAYLKGDVTYSDGTLDVAEMTVNEMGTVQRNRQVVNCLYAGFFAETTVKKFQIVKEKDIELTPIEDQRIRERLASGHLPRLKLETISGGLEYYQIESAEIQSDASLWFKSYRQAAFNAYQAFASFNVYTFDFTHCQYSHEVSSLDKTDQWPVIRDTYAKAMTLYFE
ncbi:hypothetical protein EGW08_003963 [Elysia chlorotica]|uniref:Uncharacterized protein n=1 Tax=Elysia chlorotica TaxID=188477 RepID=A0A3S1BPA9_ELYCH|nr:hypothetical protein EGW08_003963 [Elysia chlorotica]